MSTSPKSIRELNKWADSLQWLFHLAIPDEKGSLVGNELPACGYFGMRGDRGALFLNTRNEAMNCVTFTDAVLSEDELSIMLTDCVLYAFVDEPRIKAIELRLGGFSEGSPTYQETLVAWMRREGRLDHQDFKQFAHGWRIDPKARAEFKKRVFGSGDDYVARPDQDTDQSPFAAEDVLA